MDEIKISQLQSSEKTSGLQFFEGRVQAGFPSPAQGEYADTIDLNHALITNPAATFCARVIGNSMIDAGINEGDLLIISRYREPVRFFRGGPKNFTYEFTEPHMQYANGEQMQGQAAYAEIVRLVKEAQV